MRPHLKISFSESPEFILYYNKLQDYMVTSTSSFRYFRLTDPVGKKQIQKTLSICCFFQLLADEVVAKSKYEIYWNLHFWLPASIRVAEVSHHHNASSL